MKKTVKQLEAIRAGERKEVVAAIRKVIVSMSPDNAAEMIASVLLGTFEKMKGGK